MNPRVKEALASAAEEVLGRRNLVRLSRFLLDRARRDYPNNMETNGELEVQRTLLSGRGDAPFVALDVGANVGRWSQALIKQAREMGVGDVRVHAFEPTAYSFESLKIALAPYRFASVVRAAMSDAVGTATVNKIHEGAGSNSLHVIPGSIISGQELCPTTTIDEYCRVHHISLVDLVKCDTEGHDAIVLTGATNMLKEQQISAFQFEYNHRWVPARRFLLDAFDLVGPLGYTIGKITPNGIEWYEAWDFELETFREANYIAARKDLVPSFRSVRWWKSR
jgi:FkbM family methyltransferase